MPKTKSIRIEQPIHLLIKKLQIHFEKKDDFGFYVSKQKIIRIAVLELISSIKKKQRR